MWFLSARNGDFPLKIRIVNTLSVSISGYAKIAIANMGFETICIAADNFDGGNSINFMAKTYIQIPMIRDPESPMKMRAG
jgi:hypothetical protein